MLKLTEKIIALMKNGIMMTIIIRFVQKLRSLKKTLLLKIQEKPNEILIYICHEYFYLSLCMGGFKMTIFLLSARLNEV